MMSHSDATLSTITFDTIGQIAITVDDLAAAKNFYQNILGMKFLFDAGHLAFLQCGNVRIMLTTPEKPEPRGGTILYYKVGDIHATCATIKNCGVSLLEEPHLIARMPDHDLWMASLNDPAGNILGIMCEVRN
jgi:methylmalonyl-CoA/ethylmalonyl-CoA epimerase